MGRTTWRWCSGACALLAVAGPAGPAMGERAWVERGTYPVSGAGELFCGIAKDGDRWVIYGENRTRGEVTVTTTLTLENMVAERHPPTKVLAPRGGQVPLAAWHVDDPDRTWRYKYRFRHRLGDANARPDLTYPYALPVSAGRSYKVSRGWNEPQTHLGRSAYAVDVSMPEGTPILAMREGTVVACRGDQARGGPGKEWEDRGNFVKIRHPDGSLGHYLHMRLDGVAVAVGDVVRRGALIGYAGATGRATGPHLHFAVHTAVDGATDRSWPFSWREQPGQAARPPRKGVKVRGFEVLK